MEVSADLMTTAKSLGDEKFAFWFFNGCLDKPQWGPSSKVPRSTGFWALSFNSEPEGSFDEHLVFTWRWVHSMSEQTLCEQSEARWIIFPLMSTADKELPSLSKNKNRIWMEIESSFEITSKSVRSFLQKILVRIFDFKFKALFLLQMFLKAQG